jgi:hypothetical protein
MNSAGERFARAIAAKDVAGLRAVLADQVDFEALTPGRNWQAGSAEEVAGEIVLGTWFGPGADIVKLLSVQAGRVADREHVAYRLLVRRSGGDYLVEQQAYYDTDGPRITWLRILCAGYQPVRAEAAAQGAAAQAAVTQG